MSAFSGLIEALERAYTELRALERTAGHIPDQAEGMRQDLTRLLLSLEQAERIQQQRVTAATQGLLNISQVKELVYNALKRINNRPEGGQP
jgi:hypothetical protein